MHFDVLKMNAEKICYVRDKQREPDRIKAQSQCRPRFELGLQFIRVVAFADARLAIYAHKLSIKVAVRRIGWVAVEDIQCAAAHR